MGNSYKENIMYDDVFEELISDWSEKFESLNYEQIERLVFYLKSIHGYDANCENSWHNHEAYEKKLSALRDSKEQILLMKKSRSLFRQSSLLHMINGLILSACLLMFFFSTWYWGVALAVLFVYVYFRSDALTLKALLANKEQDRRYFLHSIRLANNCTELNWSGFFSYYDGFKEGHYDDRQTKIHDENVDKISRKFRNALYNDEYLEWLSV
jgi:hypothetical protein